MNLTPDPPPEAVTCVVHALTLTLTSQTHPPTPAQMRDPDARNRYWMVLRKHWTPPWFVRVWEGEAHGRQGRWYHGPDVEYPVPLTDTDLARFTHWFRWPTDEEMTPP